MTFVSLVCLIYCLLPAVSVVLTILAKKIEAISIFNWVGIGTVVLRILCLLPILDIVLLRGENIHLNLGFIDEFSIKLSTEWTGHRLWFLLVLDFCFLMSHLMSSPTASSKKLINSILSLLQGLITVYILCSNLLLAYAFQICAALALFYLIRFSLSDEEEETAYYISGRVMVIYSTLAVLGIIWAIVEFSPIGGRDSAALILSHSREASAIAISLWLVSLLISVPISPWSSWFNRAISVLPEAITVPLIVFSSAVVLRNAEIYLSAYGDLEWQYKLVIYLFGLLGCVYSLASFFAMSSRRAMLGYIAKFFFSLLLIAIGVARESGGEMLYLICLFLPIFSALILCASALQLNATSARIFMGFFLLFLLGVPGTPVYQIFSLIGSRSLAMGVNYALVFALIWFLYFYVNVHIYKRIFLDEARVETGVSSILSREPISVTSYAIFLLLFMCFVALANRGLV